MDMLDLSHLDAKIAAAPVKYVDKAVLGVAQFPAMYYHGMGEAIPNFHIRACLGFGHCNGSATDGATFVRIEWAQYLHDPSWPEVLPAVNEALKCLTDKASFHLEDERPDSEVVMLREALIGLGPYNRFYSSPETRQQFDARFVDPPRWIMDSFRQRIGSCLGFELRLQKREALLNITLINRGDTNRHFLNEESILRNIRNDFAQEVDVVRVIRPHEMSLKHALEASTYSSISILTHGAAMSNLMFMPRGSAAIEHVWHPSFVQHHDWTSTIVRQSVLDASFIGTHNHDDRLGEWIKERFLYQEGFGRLSQDELLMFYQNGPLDFAALDGLDRFQNGNFYIEWAVLKPAIARAISEIRSGKHTFDMDTGREQSWLPFVGSQRPLSRGKLFKRIFGFAGAA